MKDLAPVWINLGSKISAGALNFLEAGVENAYLGDPCRAMIDEGEGCYEALVRMLAVSVKRLLNQQGRAKGARFHFKKGEGHLYSDFILRFGLENIVRKNTLQAFSVNYYQ